VVEALIEILTRHPMREEEVIAALDKWAPREIVESLHRLSRDGRVGVITRFGRRFWSTSGTTYASEQQAK
jgi:hypothetical protein